jgi:hypothetical protein
MGEEHADSRAVKDERSSVSYGNARKIRAFERDRALSVDDARWPSDSASLEHWDTRSGGLRRVINAGKALPQALEESVLRFPSAPLHGLQRLHEHHVHLGESESLHTYRVLRTADPSVWQKPVKRIFLMHSGLNERDSMGLYYRIASQLILHEETTACVVRPFPGHLTRFPFQGFAETPLDRYLWDGSHLFRQFMRHRIETRWLLSALARRSSYRNASGANLLAESDDRAASRLNPDFLASAMADAWERLHAKSKLAIESAAGVQARAPRVKEPPPLEVFRDSIVSIRDLLALDRDYPGMTGGESPETPADPALHVFGYSLGGFTAQSVFMSWPFMITSCCALLGAGALRELAPTAFADAEEWQTVLHSLRYELDDRMMAEEIVVEDGAIAGVEHELFGFFKRTFYEVFQQDYRGSFQTRLESFRKRMLFVVGGNDPIVRPESVLDAAPPGGINLLEMGGIGHFLDGRAESRGEEQQRTFWVPEMTAVLSRFADGATEDQELERPCTSFDADMNKPASSKEDLDSILRMETEQPEETAGRLHRLTAAEFLAIGRDGALPGEIFERCLDDVLARVESTAEEDEGVLFMLRNEVPTLLLHDSLIRERAAALYHDDIGIIRYCHGVDARRAVVREHVDDVCMVLPWNARRIMSTMDLQRAFPSQAESAGGHVVRRLDDEQAWQALGKECNRLLQGDGRDSIRMFNGDRLLAELPESAIPGELRMAAEQMLGKEALTRIASLPDCWVWVSRSVLGTRKSIPLTVGRAIKDLADLVGDLEAGARSEVALLNDLRTDRIRIITVSRARYNPRFRGRLIVDPKRARRLLLHVSLCLTLSKSIADSPFQTVFA